MQPTGRTERVCCNLYQVPLKIVSCWERFLLPDGKMMSANESPMSNRNIFFARAFFATHIFRAPTYKVVGDGALKQKKNRSVKHGRSEERNKKERKEIKQLNWSSTKIKNTTHHHLSLSRSLLLVYVSCCNFLVYR